MRKVFIIPFFFLAFSLCAGDIANFVNLGFSKNGNYFLFGQYGLQEEKNQSYAEAFLVDCQTNQLVPRGCSQLTREGLPLLGNDGIGLLFQLIRENNKQIESFEVDHANNGKAVFFLGEGETPKEELSFRIFDPKSRIQTVGCRLVQSAEGEGNSLRSRFHLLVKLTNSNGVTEEKTVGHPDFKRNGVAGYFIKNVILSRDEKNLVFVIAKKEAEEKSTNIRYMVEVVQLQ